MEQKVKMKMRGAVRVACFATNKTRAIPQRHTWAQLSKGMGRDRNQIISSSGYDWGDIQKGARIPNMPNNTRGDATAEGHKRTNSGRDEAVRTSGAKQLHEAIIISDASRPAEGLRRLDSGGGSQRITQRDMPGGWLGKNAGRVRCNGRRHAVARTEETSGWTKGV